MHAVEHLSFLFYYNLKHINHSQNNCKVMANVSSSSGLLLTVGVTVCKHSKLDTDMIMSSDCITVVLCL